MMTEMPKTIDHSLIEAPTIFWTEDSIFLGDFFAKPVWKLWKLTYLRWNTYCKIKRILDSSGKRFVVDRFEELPPSGPIAAFFRQKYWQTWVTPIIVSEKQLSLDEFKREVLRAVKARHRHDDPDSAMMMETMNKLPQATTYREVIESLPRLL